MRKTTVIENVTLDGVMQAPGRSDEDTRDGFTPWGWALPWENSILLAGDAVRAVDGLKRQPGPDLAVLGSGEFVAALTRANLVDVFVLLIHPLLLGTGRHLFPGGTRPAHLKLATAVTTNPGVVIATYDTQFVG